MFCKKGILKNFAKFTGKQLCQILFFNKVVGLRPATLIIKETLAQVFSFEICEIFENALFYRTSPVAASVFSLDLNWTWKDSLEKISMFFTNSIEMYLLKI